MLDDDDERMAAANVVDASLIVFVELWYDRIDNSFFLFLAIVFSVLFNDNIILWSNHYQSKLY